jgi:predicted membrane-bound mannosyltransferase
MDSLRTYLPWLGRAGGGSPHVHPVWFYAERLFWRPSGHPLPWTELGILILAGAGARAGFTNRRLGDSSGPFVRWLTFYSGILFVIYSLIPYKTPWCILGAAHGMVLLAGVGMAAVWRIAWKLPQRVALGAFTVVLLPWLCVQAWALSHSQTSTRGNPWAYADTTPDVRNLLGLVEELAAHSPRHRGMNIQVLCEEDDYWPLPYYLRAYDHTGWWDQLPPEPLAPVLIASPGLASVLGESSDHWQVGLFQLRHGVFLSCHVEKGLWGAFLDARSSD